MRRRLPLYGLLGMALTLALTWGVQPIAAPESSDTQSSSFLRLTAGQRQITGAETDQFFRESQASPFSQRGGVIQFDRLPDSSIRVCLEAQGVQLYEYLPDKAFLATIPSSLRKTDLDWAGIRWVSSLRSEEKIAEVLDLGGTPEWSRDSSGLARFKVKVYGHISPDEATSWLAGQYGAQIIGVSSLANAVDVGLPAENWYDIARDERVVWIEPFFKPRELNNSCRANSAAEVAQAPPYSLDGAGVWIGEWDAGRADPAHTDFGGRVHSGDNSPVHTHSTHVAGTVMGSGLQSGGTYRGMAPGAELVSYQWWSGISGLQSSYQRAIDDFHIDVSQNSWGPGFSISPEECNAVLGNYFLECGTLDEVARSSLGRPVSISWSAGNERSLGSNYCGSLGMSWGTIIPYGTAKNVITVGAVNSNNSSMTSFSSWGPTHDGRIKPELVAAGCQSDGDFGVTSTKPGSGYTTMCGTSMASPVVSGCIALWLQQYRNLHPAQNPLASTVKSVFVETADDLGEAGPSFDYGFGRINVAKAVDLLNAGNFLEEQIANADVFTWTFNWDGSFPQVSFTLAWDDPAAAENANPTLVNDLDLKLVSPSGLVTAYPWKLDPANPIYQAAYGIDHTNNIEQVRRNAPLQTGLWKVMITGYNVPVGPQKFSLAFTPGLVLTQVEPNYSAQLTAGPNQFGIPGHRPFSFEIRNLGRRDDTYDLTLSSSRGWNITPNPTVPSVPGLKSSILTFDDFVPYGTNPGVVDTVIAHMVSRTDSLIQGTGSLLVTVLAGYGVILQARLDTAGVPQRAIAKTASLINPGTLEDVINWSVTDQLGWPVVPSSGSFAMGIGAETTFTLTATIPATAVPGSLNRLVVLAVSQSDTTKKDRDTVSVQVIAYPPQPVLKTFTNGVLSNSTNPLFVWSHVPYTVPPPGFGIFIHAVEIGNDTNLTIGVTRYNAIADTQAAISGLPDGVHYWRAITYNAAGDSSGFSASARLELDTQPPDPAFLISPADQAANSDSTPVFVWSPGPNKTAQGVTEYLWQLSFDSLFATVRNSLITTATTYQLPIYAPYLNTCHVKVFWRVSTKDPAGNLSIPAGPNRYYLFRRGDVNNDCEATNTVIDVFDITALIDFVFAGKDLPLSPEEGEVNCIPGTDVFDLIYLIDYVFSGGPAPCGPE